MTRMILATLSSLKFESNVDINGVCSQLCEKHPKEPQKKMKVYLSFQTGVLASLLDLPELLEQVFQFLNDSSLTNIILTCNKKHFFGEDFILNRVSFWRERISSSGVMEYLNDRIDTYTSKYKEQERKEMEKYKALFEQTDIENPKEFIMTLRQQMHQAYLFEENGDEDSEDESQLSLEESPSNRAGCRGCRKKIDQGIVRLLCYTERSEYNYYDSKEYFHIECLSNVLTGKPKQIQEKIDSIRVPSGSKFQKAYKKIQKLYGKEDEEEEEGEDNCPYVFVCDVCGRMNTGENNYCCYTCSSDPKNEIDYCQLCHDLGKEKHKDCADFTEEDVLYEFNCCKCSNKILDCMFHCQVCEEGHDICKSCFDKIMEDEKNGKKDTTSSEDLTHPFFLIGNAMAGEESNSLKRKEMDDSHSTCESKKRKVVSLSEYLRSHDFSL